MIDIQKLTVPLTITAAVIGIAVFLRSENKGLVTGNLPLPQTVPTFANVPVSPYNIATPVPPPQVPAISPAPFLPYTAPAGLTLSGGFGQSFSASSVNGNQTDCGCGCGSAMDLCAAGGGSNQVYPYYSQISQSAAL